jgi:DNA repair protein RadD
MLRPYQQRAIDQLYKWLESNEGHPCLVLPTGSGKSHIIAELCKDALQNWPDTRILMLAGQKELIEQNSAKLRQHWKNAPLGIYSASIGKRQLGEPITFAGIQSVRKRSKQLGHVDLIIVDECHLISHKDEGGYRTLIKELTAINPALRLIGLTASPYRLGHGLITDKPAIFDALIEPVLIEELVKLGFLSILRSKATRDKLDTTGVKKRGGDFIESELQKAVNVDSINQRVVQEIIDLAGDRKSWLVFCAGVDHAGNVSQCFINAGISSACLTGKTSKGERQRTIERFKQGHIKALTNVSVLTTGFDYPDIDLIAMLRPTMSPGLYLQMAGRGLRPKSHTDHCLVLDFAGVVEQHGPIIAIEPPSKTEEGTGEPVTKQCPQCREIVSARRLACDCGFEFPEPEKPEADLRLRTDDIMGIEPQEMEVTDWSWRVHTSRTSGKEMLAVTYYSGMLGPSVTEYFPVTHDGYAGDKAMKLVTQIVTGSGAKDSWLDLQGAVNSLNQSNHPTSIRYRMDGKYHRVISRKFRQVAKATN